MKIEKKQCTRCRQPLLLECFRINKRTAQLTKYCAKCLDKSIQQTKCGHNKKRSTCKDCGGGHICRHIKARSECKDCGGSRICEYNKKRSHCKDCGGGHICEHNKIRSKCKHCGRSQICEHNKQRSKCKDCGGIQICEHNKIKSQCKNCDPPEHLVGVLQSRVYTAFKNDKEMSSIEYLGCNIQTFKNILNNS